jgi:hypothetical protein
VALAEAMTSRLSRGALLLASLASGTVGVAQSSAVRTGVAETPIVVPVHEGSAPYTSSALSTVLAGGAAIEGKCHALTYFMAREAVDYDACLAVRVLPWVSIGNLRERAPQELAMRVVLHADSMLRLADAADSVGRIPALVGAVVGLAQPVQVNVAFISPIDSTRVESVLLVPLPRDSMSLTEESLVRSLPAVYGVPNLLMRDSAGAWRADPEGLDVLGWLAPGRPPLREVRRGLAEGWRTGTYACGEEQCIERPTPIRAPVIGAPRRDSWYLFARGSEDVRLQLVRNGSDATARELVREIRLAPPLDWLRVPLTRGARTDGAWLEVQWESGKPLQIRVR